MNFSISRTYTFAGVNITESIYAMVDPSGHPFTDDMREMVDHMRALGLIRKKPGAFTTPNGMIVHPEIMRSIRQELSRRMDDMLVSTAFGGRP